MAEEFEGQSHSAVANIRAREDLNNTITEMKFTNTIKTVAKHLINVSQQLKTKSKSKMKN